MALPGATVRDIAALFGTRGGRTRRRAGALGGGGGAARDLAALRLSLRPTISEQLSVGACGRAGRAGDGLGFARAATDAGS